MGLFNSVITLILTYVSDISESSIFIYSRSHTITLNNNLRSNEDYIKDNSVYLPSRNSDTALISYLSFKPNQELAQRPPNDVLRNVSNNLQTSKVLKQYIHNIC